MHLPKVVFSWFFPFSFFCLFFFFKCLKSTLWKINGSLFWNNKLVGDWQRPGSQGLVHISYQHSFGSEDDYRLVSTGSWHSFWSEDDERLVPPAVATHSGGSRRSHWCPFKGGGVGVGPTTFIKISINCGFSQKVVLSTLEDSTHKKRKSANILWFWNWRTPTLIVTNL